MAENGEEEAKKLEEGAAVVVGPAEEPLASATADNVLEVPSGADTSANEEKNENVDKQGLAEVDPKDVAPSLANPKTPKVGEPNRNVIKKSTMIFLLWSRSHCFFNSNSFISELSP